MSSKKPTTKKNQKAIDFRTFFNEKNQKPDQKVPDYWIEYSISDYLTGKDPLLEKAMELIKKISTDNP